MSTFRCAAMRERGTFARESCDDEKDRLKRSTPLCKYSTAKATPRRTKDERVTMSLFASLLASFAVLCCWIPY